MKYMLLMHGNKQGWSDMAASWSHDDITNMVKFMRELDQELKDSGELVETRGLAGPEQMKTVQAQDDGETIVTDGPFGETKEVLAGYWVVDVASEERVIELATYISRTPGPGGRPVNQAIEIHPEGVAPE
jgi:hypothetical protein